MQVAIPMLVPRQPLRLGAARASRWAPPGPCAKAETCAGLDGLASALLGGGGGIGSCGGISGWFDAARSESHAQSANELLEVRQNFKEHRCGDDWHHVGPRQGWLFPDHLKSS